MTTAPASALPTASFYRMTAMEVATGWLTGEDRTACPSQSPAGGAPPDPMSALDDLLRPALRRPPCVVAFSGGRDSAAVLAVATDLARREGLRDPVPATIRYPGVGATHEDNWQELVVRHLGLTEWERIAVDGELELLGPVATQGLLRHGLLWPPAIHTRQPLLSLATGGFVVTGEGGDEVFGDRRITAVTRALRGRWQGGWDRPDKLAFALAPRPLRRVVVTTRLRKALTASWLRPGAQERFASELAADDTDEPLSWRGSLLRLPRLRAFVEGFHNMRQLAVAERVDIVHPFLDPHFVAGVAGAGPGLGFADRTAAMRRLFGALLPAEVLSRQTKARFNEAAVGATTRAFIETWSGGGVPEDLVDPEALLRTWRNPAPHAMSLALLQAAWLSDQAR